MLRETILPKHISGKLALFFKEVKNFHGGRSQESVLHVVVVVVFVSLSATVAPMKARRVPHLAVRI